MENKEYRDTHQDYCAPEQESVDSYNRPVYETAEEYNQANHETGNYNQQYNDQQYGYDNQQYNNQQYGYDNQQYNNQQYGYDNQQSNNQQYGYNNQQYNYQQYGNAQYANLGGAMVDAAGNPLKSRFAIQLTFAIIEILLCCFSPAAMVLGIIALVFAVQANTAFQMGRAEVFKAKSKTANILLIVGGVIAAIGIIINIAVSILYVSQFEAIFSEIQNEWNEEDWDDEGWDDEGDAEDEIYEEYPGTMDVYLVDGFADFTHNGVAYSVPMSYSDFEKMGYTLEEGYEDYVIEAQNYEILWFYDEEGNELGSVRISNDTKEELPLEEGVVDYIYFDNPASYITDGSVEHIDLVFGNGFDMLTTYEELEAWLGTPYYISIDNSDGTEYARYEWTYYGDDKYQSIIVNYLDGIITDVSFEQYDFVY